MLMGRKLKTQLDLVHPDTYQKPLKTEQGGTSQDRKCRTFQIDDRVFARNYSNNQSPKWVTAKVIKITGPVSYQVRTSQGLVEV